MKQSITLNICLGTTCYILGSSDLISVEEYLPRKIRNNLAVTGSPCLGCCKDSTLSAPFIKINEEIYGTATREKIIHLLREARRADNE
ncbi:MAG: NAD(P)H-dependent oxidoreductase subunit E [Fibrobacterota bacterium]